MSSITFRSGAFLFMVGLGLSANVAAQVDPVEIDRLMGIMQRHVQERRLRDVPAARLGQSALAQLKLVDRFYRVGETWTVRFMPTGDPNLAAMPMKTALIDSGPLDRQQATYVFTVLSVSAEAAELSITQKLAQGEGRAEERVDHLVLSMNRQFVPIKKVIFYRDGRGPRSIPLDVHGAAAFGFSAAPTDLSNLGQDDGAPAQDEATGKKALEFHTLDVYARPVTVLWREGEVWPARVETVAGVAVLGEK